MLIPHADAQALSAALVAVARWGDAKAVRLLVDRGADVNARDADGRTALMLACNSDTLSLDVVKLLIARGADVNAKTPAGQTAAGFAAIRGGPIAQKLARDIAIGRYELGQRLPSERELAQTFSVSRPTVREAIIALELDGLGSHRACVDGSRLRRIDLTRQPSIAYSHRPGVLARSTHPHSLRYPSRASSASTALSASMATPPPRWSRAMRLENP